MWEDFKVGDQVKCIIPDHPLYGEVGTVMDISGGLLTMTLYGTGQLYKFGSNLSVKKEKESPSPAKWSGYSVGDKVECTLSPMKGRLATVTKISPYLLFVKWDDTGDEWNFGSPASVKKVECKEHNWYWNYSANSYMCSICMATESDTYDGQKEANSINFSQTDDAESSANCPDDPIIKTTQNWAKEMGAVLTKMTTDDYINWTGPAYYHSLEIPPLSVGYIDYKISSHYIPAWCLLAVQLRVKNGQIYPQVYPMVLDKILKGIYSCDQYGKVTKNEDDPSSLLKNTKENPHE